MAPWIQIRRVFAPATTQLLHFTTSFLSEPRVHVPTATVTVLVSLAHAGDEALSSLCAITVAGFPGICTFSLVSNAIFVQRAIVRPDCRKLKDFFIQSSSSPWNAHNSSVTEATKRKTHFANVRYYTQPAVRSENTTVVQPHWFMQTAQELSCSLAVGIRQGKPPVLYVSAGRISMGRLSSLLISGDIESKMIT